MPSTFGELPAETLDDLVLGRFAFVGFVHPQEHDAGVDLTALLDVRWP